MTDFRATELRLTSQAFHDESERLSKQTFKTNGSIPSLLVMATVNKIACEITAALAIDLEVMARND